MRAIAGGSLIRRRHSSVWGVCSNRPWLEAGLAAPRTFRRKCADTATGKRHNWLLNPVLPAVRSSSGWLQNPVRERSRAKPRLGSAHYPKAVKVPWQTYAQADNAPRQKAGEAHQASIPGQRKFENPLASKALASGDNNLKEHWQKVADRRNREFKDRPTIHKDSKTGGIRKSNAPDCNNAGKRRARMHLKAFETAAVPAILAAVAMPAA
jgi:hypothetical protein